MIKNLLDEEGNKITNNLQWLIGIVFTDAHYPNQNLNMIQNIVKLAHDLQPHTILNLGDCIDADSVSFFLKDNALKKLGMRLCDLLLMLQQCLHLFDDVLSVRLRIFILGNHEYRIQRYIQLHSELYGMFSVLKSVKLCDWLFISLGNFIKKGNVVFMHGEYFNQYNCMKTLNQYSCDVCFGHSHNLQMDSKPTKLNGIIKAYSIGCACTLQPDYKHGKSSRWSNAFAVYYYDKVNLKCNIKVVLVAVDGTFIYNSKIYS